MNPGARVLLVLGFDVPLELSSHNHKILTQLSLNSKTEDKKDKIIYKKCFITITSLSFYYKIDLNQVWFGIPLKFRI